MNRILIILVVLIAFVDGILVSRAIDGGEQASLVQAMRLTDTFEQKTSSTDDPVAKIWNIPSFITQAPTGSWKKPWDSMAEEASVFMAAGKDSSLAAESLQAMADWELVNLGTSADTDLNQTLLLAREYMGLNGEISTNLDIEALKRELDAGTLFLVPVSGEILANRHYGKPAPQHHMILIYGYSEQGFLAHDPGTIRGASTLYTFEKTLEAIQDLNGEKRILLIKP